MTRPLATHALAHCFAVHRELFEAAELLAHKLTGRFDDVDLLSLGGRCIRMAAQEALAARDERQMLKGWRHCALGERQVCIATYRALRAGRIDNRVYDRMFRLVADARRFRDDEMQQLRWRLRRLDML